MAVTDNASESREKTDVPLLVLSALLLLAMAAATLYGIRYGNVDESVVPGSVSIVRSNQDDGVEQILDITVDDSLDATIMYRGLTIKGHLTLDGAEKDTILYKTTGLEYVGEAWLEGVEGELDPKESALLIRIPRSGLQGDLSGPWMVYYSYFPTGFTMSDWVIAHEDGSALDGSDVIVNPMTALRKQVEEQSTPTNWKRLGRSILVYIPDE